VVDDDGGTVVARQRAGQRRPGQGSAPYRGPGWTRPPTLGVDVGGVIVVLADHGEDTSFFGSDPLQTPAVAGVFEGLAALTAGPFGGRVHLVSKAGPKVAANTRAWLAHHSFFDHTGIAEANLHFVRERRDKAPVCQRLGVTHFVDDRRDVLAYLETVEHRYLFTGGGAGQVGVIEVPDWATVAATWTELTAMLTAAMPATTPNPTGTHPASRG
jgi:hypothetical protein